ncbi:MAG: potassium transporter [Deltaproteobacteria bacterium]|nr:MAG: potassium transporter [Deltaproteobacteria bacterium]
METIWIVGAGGFGMRAVTALSNRHNNLEILLVDRDRKKLDQARGLDCITVHSDGAAYLETHLKPGKLPLWIVPAVPVHLAWEWCRRQLGPEWVTPVNISSEIDGKLPNPMHGSNGDIYVSHADFMCPVNCSEPDDICTVTQQPRKQEMFKLLSKLQFKAFSSLVIQSQQLAPGVGGYSPEALFSLLKKIEGVKGPFLLSTACRCHGVITGGTRKG